MAQFLFVRQQELALGLYPATKWGYFLPMDLVIRLSWVTIVSPYRPIDMYGQPHRILGKAK